MTGLRVVLLLFVAGAVPSAIGCADAPSAEEPREDDYTIGDFPEDTVLPYRSGWVDPPKALAGVGQYDRLRGTIYDDFKCSTMVAIGAAVIGGKERFVRFIDEVARIRAGRREDLAAIERVRVAVNEDRLTPRHLHELSEAVVRAYKVGNGAYDEQIATMIRASGYVSVHVGSTRPEVLVDRLLENEVTPLAVVTAGGIPHITLMWKDARGTVRIYDSEDIGGAHVLPRGSAKYRERVESPEAGWELAEKYR